MCSHAFSGRYFIDKLIDPLINLFPIRNITAGIKFVIIFFLITHLFTNTCQAQDLIIMTNGDELYGKVEKIINNVVTISPTKNSKSSNGTETIDARDIYMIKYKERGNVYILSDGRRNTGENQKIGKDADIIYLLSGMEIPAWYTKMEYGVVHYYNDKNKKNAKQRIVNSNQIFLIKYADGSRDVINDLSAMRHEEREKEEMAKKQKNENKEAPQYKVVFHTVKSGETLNSIADLYKVTIPQIREWNEISSAIKDNSKLKTGTQLMIQQLIK